MTAPVAAVRGVRVVPLRSVVDQRGALTFAERGAGIPFPVERFFVLHGFAEGATRGHHAHREQSQFFVCLAGSCRLGVDDGRERASLVLDDASTGVEADPLTWVVIDHATPDAVLLVLTSGQYDEAEYVRDRGEFERLAAAR